MVKLIKLAVGALVLYGCWHAALAQWDHFEFIDRVRQIAEYGTNGGDDAARAAVVVEATRLGIQIEPSRVSIRRTSDRLYIDVAYTRQVRVLPWYRYNWAFEVKIERWFVPGGGPAR